MIIAHWCSVSKRQSLTEFTATSSFYLSIEWRKMCVSVYIINFQFISSVQQTNKKSINPYSETNHYITFSVSLMDSKAKTPYLAFWKKQHTVDSTSLNIVCWTKHKIRIHWTRTMFCKQKQKIELNSISRFK